jgi:Skp family chaperone for outer membrane proteins
MIDGTLVFMIFGFISVIGAIFWSEHRQTRLMNARIDELKADYQKEMAAFKADYQKEMAAFKADYQKEMAAFKADYQREMAAFKADYQREMAEFKAAYQNDMSDLKAEMRTQDERHRILEGKVDRIQGSLDVLIHTYRHESLAQPVEERQASESSVN